MATVYVSTSGLDTNSGTLASPFRTFDKAISVTVAGGTIIVRGLGLSYVENVDQTMRAIPNGTGFPAGATTFQAFPGEKPTLNGYVYLLGNFNIIWDGIDINGAGISSFSGQGQFEVNGGNHIRCTNCSIYNARATCVLCADNNSTYNNIEFTNLHVHDSGQVVTFPGQHGFYLSASVQVSQSGPVLIDRCEADHNTASVASTSSFGIQVYDGGLQLVTNVTVSNCNLHENGSGLLIGCTSNHIAYNNTIWGNIGGAADNGDGIEVGYGNGNNCQIYNNTIYNNVGYAIYLGIVSSPTNTIVKDCIFYLNGLGDVINNPHGLSLTASNNLASNPTFVNAALHNFHLQSTSAAILFGANLTSLGIAGLDVDKDGTPRPPVINWDAGAFQFGDILLGQMVM